MSDTSTTELEKRARLVEALNKDLQRKSKELFRYAHQADPYVPRGCDFYLETYKMLAPIDDDNSQMLTAAIEQLGGIAAPGSWAIGIEEMNYLDIRYLNGKIIKILKHTLEQLEEHTPLAADFPRIAGIVETVIEDTKYQIEILEGLESKKPDAVFATRKKKAEPAANADGG